MIRYKFNMTMKNVEIVSIVIITLITPKVFRSLNFLCGNHSSSNHFKCKAHYFETASSFWASHSRWSFYCFTQTRIDHCYNVCKKINMWPWKSTKRQKVMQHTTNIKKRKNIKYVSIITSLCVDMPPSINLINLEMLKSRTHGQVSES